MRIYTLLLLLFGTMDALMGQQLPVGTCGIVNVYDNAGNRTRRVYFCNNGTDPYPQKGQQPVASGEDVADSESKNTVFESVDALFPNPTTGRFSITFKKAVVNATLSIIDNTGKVLVSFTGNGSKAEFDLLPYPGGIYYVRIEEGGKIVTKKVIKQ